MLVNILGVAVVFVLAIIFFWLLARALRARGCLKYPAGLVAGLLGLLLAVIGIISVVGLVKAYGPRPNAASNLKVVPTTEMIARGEGLAHLCINCHSSTGQLPLDGSSANLLEKLGAPPIGAFWAPNLTPGGPLKGWTDGEIMRALREGVGRDGRTLLGMPATGFHGMSDADAQALVAYVRSQPPVTRAVPAVQPNLAGVALIGSGMFTTSALPPIAGPRAAPPRGVTPEYGEYIVNMVGCKDCHGPDLAGRVKKSPIDVPSAPNLPATAGTWTPAEFVKTIRSGVTPQGLSLNTDMPWKDFSGLGDDELQAVHAYIKSLSTQ